MGMETTPTNTDLYKQILWDIEADVRSRVWTAMAEHQEGNLTLNQAQNIIEAIDRIEAVLEGFQYRNGLTHWSYW